MWFYASLLVLPAAWALALAYRPASRNPAAVAICISLILFIGLRREVGGDWDSYAIFFRRAQDYDLPTALALTDPGYMLMNKLVAELGLGIGVVNLLAASILSIGLIRFCERSASPPAALLIAIPVLILIVAMGFVRQSAAFGILLIGLTSNRSPIATVSIFATACLFHWSAAVMLPLGILMGLGRPVPVTLAVGLGIAAACALIVAPFLIPKLWIYHADFRLPRGAVFRLFPSLIALMVNLGAVSRLQLSGRDQIQAAFGAGLTAFVWVMLPFYPTVADRLGFYTIVFQMQVATAAIAHSNGVRRAVAGSVLVLPSLILFAGWIIFSPYALCWAPYRNFITEPRAFLDPNTNILRTSHACAALQDQPARAPPPINVSEFARLPGGTRSH